MVQELRCKIQKGIITRREFRSVSEMLFEGGDLVSCQGTYFQEQIHCREPTTEEHPIKLCLKYLCIYIEASKKKKKWEKIFEES